MSGEFFESTKEASQRLASIEHHFDTPLDPSVVEFSHLLADRLNPELVPMGFVMAGSLLTYDLQTGLNGFTGEPIDSSLIHQSPELYKGLIGRLPALAEFAFSAQFAAEICPIIDEVTKQPLNIQGSSVEEILAQPIELEHVRGPDTLPEPGVVEVIAVLEDGTKLYSDQELMMLGNEFDPTTYSDPRGSAYGDASIEMILDPLMALGKANGQYFGLDAKGLWKIANIGFNPDGLPDVRKVDLDGQTIYFPTQQMLEKMGVVRRGVELTEPVNTAGVLSYLMRTTSLGDETPDSAEWLPEVDLPGLDPYEIVRSNGELPEKGILLEAQMVRGGNAVFMIYDYDNIENVELD